jgi:2,3-bisphosphoglycerate-dependent phosphoglycerate mutase
MFLYCVRHGESTYNVEGRLQGQSDLPRLSPLGQRQSEAVAAVLANLPIDAIYASPLPRARQTADAIARPLGLEVRPDDRLKEVNVGIFQDRLRSEVEMLYPNELGEWLSGDPDFAIPGGESRRQLARRGRDALESIARAGHRHAVVVAHGGLLVSSVKSLLGIPLREPPLALENASITTLFFHEDGRAELVALDQVDHLADLRRGGVGDLAV